MHRVADAKRILADLPEVIGSPAPLSFISEPYSSDREKMSDSEVNIGLAFQQRLSARIVVRAAAIMAALAGVILGPEVSEA
jgi:hypothetical protein